MGNISHYEREMYKCLVDPIVEAAEQERPSRDLESDACYKARLTKQVHRSFNDFKNRIKAGIQLLVQHKKWPNDDLARKTTKLLYDRTGWNEEMSQCKTIQDILHLSDEQLSTFYVEGWEIFQKGFYEDASHIFLLLTQLNPKVGAFWSALGSAEEKRGELSSGLQAYILASELETQTLAPYLHGAKCLLLLNKTEEAKKILYRAIERAEEEHGLNDHKETAEQMLQSIK